MLSHRWTAERLPRPSLGRTAPPICEPSAARPMIPHRPGRPLPSRPCFVHSLSSAPSPTLRRSWMWSFVDAVKTVVQECKLTIGSAGRSGCTWIKWIRLPAPRFWFVGGLRRRLRIAVCFVAAPSASNSTRDASWRYSRSYRWISACRRTRAARSARRVRGSLCTAPTTRAAGFTGSGFCSLGFPKISVGGFSAGRRKPAPNALTA